MKHSEFIRTSSDSQPGYNYVDIYNKFKKDIRDKVFESGEKLPSEKELSEYYDVKRFVVRNAIKKLITDGLVFVIRNKGYYVKAKDINVRIHRNSNYTQNMIAKKMVPKVKLLELKTVRPSKEQQELFDLNNEDMLWEIYVLRYYKNVPYLLGKSYIPCRRAPDFNLHYIKSMSIYKVLKEKFRIEPTRKSSICRASVSDKKESRLLSIFENSPILKVTSINVDQNNVPIEQCISKFRSDIVQINVNL